jgi:perosamine synthetase
LSQETIQTARTIQIASPCLGEEEWRACREPLLSGWLTQGPKVAEFERAFAHRHGAEHGVAATSCTTALHLALAARGVGPGDEVIVPGFTWVATANVVRHCGATPVFADVDPRTYNVDPERVAARLSGRTRAVVPVHLFGLCADIDAIQGVLPDDVFVLEDAACAAAATYHGRVAGSLGHAAAFSFHPRKSITTGEGGMITTNNLEFADRARVLRNHGGTVSEEDRHLGPQPFVLPDFDEVGFNYRMTDLQAAVGLVQLGKLDAFVEERRRWAGWYTAELEAIEWLAAPVVPEGYGHAWQAFVTVVGDEAPAPRNELMARLQERGVSTRPGTHAVSELGAYEAWNGSCPVAADLQMRTMALPLHNRMTEDDYRYVVDELRRL